ncbi:hypothetical protein [Streptomyces chryseus]|uniref:hypothetical protein n=1 Tax=Streptomyces chryseus TaxID=68186 RepID=UPI0014772F71|nr:hypothetical protein [Streptomyces chryseus]
MHPHRTGGGSGTKEAAVPPRRCRRFHALSRRRADEVVLGLTRTIGRLRPVPEVIEGLA